MLRSEAFGQQDGVCRLKSGRIRDQLADVVVIGGSVHVLDHDTAGTVGVAEDQIGAVATDWHLGAFQGEVQPKAVTNDVGILGQPWRQVVCLVRSEFAHGDGLKHPDAAR